MVCQELVWIITGNDWIWGRVKQLSNALLFYPGPSHRSSAEEAGLREQRVVELEAPTTDIASARLRGSRKLMTHRLLGILSFCNRPTLGWPRHWSIPPGWFQVCDFLSLRAFDEILRQ